MASRNEPIPLSLVAVTIVLAAAVAMMTPGLGMPLTNIVARVQPGGKTVTAAEV